jgi:hypothetical protein
LRLRLWREHLDRPDDGSADGDLLEPTSAVAAITSAAQKLQDWYDTGRVGPRPPGRLRPHRPELLGPLTRMWAVPVYRFVYDPDGRPTKARRSGLW